MNIGTMNIDNLIDTMTEDDAFRLLPVLERRFGWSVALLNTTDIEEAWRDHTGDDPTPAQVETVRESRDWTKWIREYASDQMVTMLRDTVAEIAGDGE